jgi:hypothetical protein
MGRENHPRERQARKLARKKARRGAYERILIVCEGEKTEPLYFEEIRREYRIHTANVRVLPSEAGTSPMQVVEFAKKVFFDEGKKFEKIYAVFDRDDHLKFHEAVDLARSLDGKLRTDEKGRVAFFALPSIPCFELWFLLHYREVNHDLHRTRVMQELKRFLPAYEKGQLGHFAITREALPTAYRNAELLAREKERQGRDFPSTDVPVLVRLLTTIRE